MGVSEYSCVVQAATNIAANTNDTFIEITAPASTGIKIKRISAPFNSGTGTTSSDSYFKFTLCRKSVAGTGGITGTIVKRDANSNPSLSTVKVKDTTIAFTVGTVSENIEIIASHQSSIFDWFAVDEADKIEIVAGGIFGLLASWGSTTQRTFTYAVSWEE